MQCRHCGHPVTQGGAGIGRSGQWVHSDSRSRICVGGMTMAAPKGRTASPTGRKCESCGGWMPAYQPRRRKVEGGPLLCDGCFNGRDGRPLTQATLTDQPRRPFRSRVVPDRTTDAYYHNSNSAFPLGTVITPGGPGGTNAQWYYEDDWGRGEGAEAWKQDWVFMTDLKHAQPRGELGRQFGKFTYRVEPLGEVVQTRAWEWVTTSARVVEVVHGDFPFAAALTGGLSYILAVGDVGGWKDRYTAWLTIDTIPVNEKCCDKEHQSPSIARKHGEEMVKRIRALGYSGVWTGEGYEWTRPDGTKYTMTKFPDLGGKHYAALAKTAEADTDGVMIAIRPPEEICKQLVEFSTEDYPNLHITLVYLGSKEDVDYDLVKTIVEAWAARTPGFDGNISGFGRFENGDEPVLYASADIPHLDEARALLVQELVRAGVAVPEDHGFSPHLTLAYGGDFPDDKCPVAGERFDIDEVAFSYGKDWNWIPLSGVRPKTGALKPGWPLARAATLTDNERATWDPDQMFAPVAKAGSVKVGWPFARAARTPKR